MSEEQQSESTEAVDSGDSPEPTNQPLDRSKPSPWRTAVAVFALILALAAIAGLAWIWLEQPEVDLDDVAAAEDLAQLQSDVSAHDQRFDELSSSLQSLGEQFEALQPELADWRRDLREQSEDHDHLNRRVADLEADLAEAVERLEAVGGEQRAVDRELARRLHLMESASLLRMGQERAELAGDFAGAREAYRRAYRLLRELDDARANRVRGQVAQELEALEGVAGPDWIAMSAQLSRIAAAADEWPARAIAEGADVTAQIDEDENGWMSRIGSTLASLVRVRPRDAVPVTTEEVDAIREQVRLRLAAAELALARRSLEETAHQLRETRDLIERWFDPDHTGVARALERLSELAGTEPAAMPSLGTALTDINQLLADS